MRLPSFKRIILADFAEEYKALMEKLSGILNIGLESLYEALNNKLTIRDNFKGMIKDVVIDSSGSSATFDLNPTGTVDVVFIGKVMNSNGGTVSLTSAPFLTWQQSQNTITVSNFVGLTSGVSYTLRLVLLYN